MRANIIVLLAIAILPFCFSCNKEYVEITYKGIYQADSIYIDSNNLRGKSNQSVYLLHSCSWSKEFEKESRRFYMEVDSNLVYKGWRYKITNTNRQYEEWCAIDWRFTKIEFITEENYDSSHPAGSLLNDLLYIDYQYMYNRVRKKLSDVAYGNLMLTDYYPYNLLHSRIEITMIDKSSTLPDKFIIRFHDAFGRVFTVDSDDWKFPSE